MRLDDVRPAEIADQPATIPPLHHRQAADAPPEHALDRDAQGFVLTGPSVPAGSGWNLDRHPYFLESSLPGLFAAGDVRHDSVKRIASAVGEGAMAVALVHRYLAQL